MSRTIFLDTGPLGVLTNPKRPTETIAALTWAVSLLSAGHRLIVPAIADYEVRRELIRAGKVNGILTLDAWNASAPDRYLPLTDSALKLAATLWANARNAGQATSDHVVATGNVAHLSRFVPADQWASIRP
jgi:hypothetical protein